MSRERGGKKIRISVSAVSYPHSNGAKKKALPELPVFDSGICRPRNAVRKTLYFLGEHGYMFSWDWFSEFVEHQIKGKS